MNTNYYRIVFPLLLLVGFLGVSQEADVIIPDSLKKRSIREIENSLNKSYGDSIKFPLYAKVLISKAKKKNNFLALLKGYAAASFSSTDPKLKIKYLDSSVVSSKNLDDKNYPAYSHSERARTYKRLGNYSKALDDYLKALQYFDEANNRSFYYETKHNIGLLKKIIYEYEDASKMFEEVLRYEDDNNISGKGHLSTMLALSSTYVKLGLQDSAAYYNKIGINESLKDSLDIYNFFVLNEGINKFYKKQHKASLDSIEKAVPIIEKQFRKINKSLLVSGYLHLGKLYKKFNNNEKVLESLGKIDTYHEETGFTSLEVSEGYEMLIKHYKAEDDKNQQLYYINKLFAVDSILDINYKDLSKKIIREYDTPRLLEEKELLISDLQKKEKKSNLKLIITLTVLVVTMVILLLQYNKNVKYKKRFNELMETKIPEANEKEISDNKDAKVAETSIGISNEIITDILNGLEIFEKKKGFLSANITTNDLAKQLNTNSKYLSKIINTYKKKSFSVYINELRIQYVIEKLKDDSKFRLYTVKAISREIGFNTTEAFSKSFYKTTGIYPSYFIKQLEK
ncbi:AraC family transcriptional regulator [Aquimarina sp. D1M17]|uniref:helix-turn-helix domain-containing protein n=1 Tax=Aquimarina acroporae TaxID=2937283 RepID=UPI0020BDE4F0|nr:AraC family transcriptional regulator [Aquimarina acroporae]MCK8520820.1 AraC family transcriptional regulator [Aquimarina acroporae]